VSASNQTFSRRVWRQLKKRRLTLVAMSAIGVLVVVALLADFIASDLPIALHHRGRTYLFPNLIDYPALQTVDNRTLRETMTPDEWAIFPLYETGPYSIRLRGLPGTPPRAPSDHQWLGSDNTGRDTFARLVHGTRISLSIGVVAVSIYLVLGAVLGLIAGFFGGWLDTGVSRVTEIMLNFPLLFLLLAIQGVLERTTIFTTMLVIGFTRWPDPARLIRAEVLKIRELDYVQAIRALGGTWPRILFRHVLPNAVAPLFVTATFGVASAILIESALSFLGFGAPEPTASWGLLMTDGFQSISNPKAWPLIVLPGLAIFVTVTAFNLVGEGLRDAIDPRLKT
jgi:peptide/nickel transport system permease protein